MRPYIILTGQDKALLIGHKNNFVQEKAVELDANKAIELAIENDITIVLDNCVISREQLKRINIKNMIIAPSYVPGYTAYNSCSKEDEKIDYTTHFSMKITGNHLYGIRRYSSLDNNDIISWVYAIDEQDKIREDIARITWLMIDILLKQEQVTNAINVEAKQYTGKFAKLKLNKVWTIQDKLYNGEQLETIHGYMELNSIEDIEYTVNKTVELMNDGKLISEVFDDSINIYEIEQ